MLTLAALSKQPTGKLSNDDPGNVVPHILGRDETSSEESELVTDGSRGEV